ncbi:MAG: CaiB/BaiF CoA-transferase family protein [Candidatus Rokubacteria bacterium]|nr:CaiB/BaiF CoA-transferase family protein [Candidatus Rokubacteria bacterium]
MSTGPLAGIKVVEIAGIGPGPFCAMMLADMGAEVLRVDRTAEADIGFAGDPRKSLLNRGRRSVAVDLKNAAGIGAVKRLVAGADALIEGFRPGVMERLGLGPDECLAANPRLVYGRMTGWGQDGPIARAAGHDINYIALSGVLHAIGRHGGPPVPPLNLVGDFGGGGMYLAFGVVCALLEAGRSGRGQVVDASMVDGSASLSTAIFGLRAMGIWSEERGDNLLDSGAPWYDVYETKDDKYVAIGSLERRFYGELMRLTGLGSDNPPTQWDRTQWPELRARLTAVFKAKTRDEWCAIMEGSDVCFAPVLSYAEAPQHPHNRARATFVEVDGIEQPAPAPRFSRTPPAIQRPPARPGEHTDEALADWGFSATDIAALRTAGALR